MDDAYILLTVTMSIMFLL